MDDSFWRREVIEPALDEDTERQIAAQKTWIAAEPSNPRPYWQLATLLRMQGKRDLALGLLLQAVRLDADFGPAHSTLAEVYAVTGDSRAAWRHARLAEKSGIVEAVEMLGRHGVPEEAARATRVCAVSYLNTVPLVWGLLHGSDRGECDLSFAVPSECARRVETGEADLGIVPVAEMHRLGWNWIRGTGIAGRGAVRTILLISKTEPARIRTLATDTGSRTSVQLSRVILKHRFGCEPALVSMPPVLGDMLAAADAALVIGDAALRIEPAELPYHVLDLGEEWWNLTGLPMVFALWAGRPDRLREAGEARLEAIFRRSLASGIENMDAIVRREAAGRGFPEPVVREYLTRYIRFDIGPEEERGLATFLRLISELA